MAYEKNATAHNNIWYLDSGCSNHMSGAKSSFKELDEVFKSEVTLEDDNQVQVDDKGIVAIRNSYGNVNLLHSVYFIPSLSQNLLSVGQLMGRGFSLLFDDDSCVIRDKKIKSNCCRS